ncbi:MAG: bacillithiol biosynthesis deacetylase BshB1 [Sphingobacteriales bacterium JAD_PAG50586_3]|nr:MAG: bacillithiol biosynthesis deacetylase BshB1 [Sphingobacteriales bacterium JAD_PAG50586_3]
MQLDILAFGAHPDDVELSCAGTLMAHIAMGKTVGIIDLTQGELGTRGTAEIRLHEAEAAAKLIGAIVRENLNMADGFFTNDKEHQLQIVKIIRKYRPQVVFANAVTDRHPDHGKGARLVADACFLAGLTKIETELDGEPQQAHRPNAIYNYIQFRQINPDFIVDISGFMDKKMESILAYGSQFYNPASGEPETVISSAHFIKNVEERASEYGRLIGTRYGEGFTCESKLGISNVFNLMHVK